MASTASKPILWFCNGCFNELTLFDDTPNADGAHIHNSFLTVCYHILCRDCRRKCDQKCVVCDAIVSFMPISSQMPQRYRQIFDDFTAFQTKFEKLVFFQRTQAQLIGKKLFIKKELYEQKCTRAREYVAKMEQECQLTRDDKHKMETIYNDIYGNHG